MSLLRAFWSNLCATACCSGASSSHIPLADDLTAHVSGTRNLVLLKCGGTNAALRNIFQPILTLGLCISFESDRALSSDLAVQVIPDILFPFHTTFA